MKNKICIWESVSIIQESCFFFHLITALLSITAGDKTEKLQKIEPKALPGRSTMNKSMFQLLVAWQYIKVFLTRRSFV